MSRTTLCSLVAALSLIATANLLAIEVGDKVQVVRSVDLKLGPETVGTVPKGAEVEIEAVKGDWVRVTYDGNNGWLRQRDVVSKTPMLDLLLTNQPRNASYYQVHGLALLARGLTNDAIASYDESIRLDPNQADSFNGRGACWYVKKEYDKAIADYNQALKLNPELADAFRNRGSARRDKGELELAIADYDEAIRRKSDQAPFYSDRGDTRRLLKQYDKALDDYNASLNIDRKSKLVWFWSGWIRGELGQPDKAIANFTEALKLDPKLLGALIDRGDAWLDKGDINKALDDFNQALKLEPTNEFALYNRGNAWRLSQQYDKALADYRAAHEANPKFSNPLNNLAWTLATCPDESNRNGKQAIQYGTMACELTKWQNVNHLAVLAAAYAEAGQFDEAIKYQQQALSLTTGQDLKADFQRRLELYRSHKPYRDIPAPPTSG